MRNMGLLATAVVGGAAILGGVLYLTNTSQQKETAPITHNAETEQADLVRSEQLLAKGSIEDALKIIHQYEDEISIRTENGKKWLDLLINASVKTANFGQLMVLYEAYPRAFQNNEQAVLMVANGYILSSRPQKYEELRELWRDKRTEESTWIVLDADALLTEGKRQEAITLLKGNKFEGKKDIDRLVRLALLYVIEDPKAAWDYLAEAYTLDPNNTDVITYRGKLLESLGKDSLALYEYLAAIQAAPDNLFLRDQLAEFYMRRNQSALALSVWLETLNRPSLDLIWIKALFWSKVLTPINFDWAKASPPTGSDKQFIEYLEVLPKETFWDESSFNKISSGKSILTNVQATFWLRLLQSLKDGDEKEAANLLQFNTFSKTMLNPQLEQSLKQILSFRATGSLNKNLGLRNEKEHTDQKIAAAPENANFFGQLSYYADQEASKGTNDVIPKDLSALLSSPEIFSATFLASGWLEAALQLHKMDVLPDDFPEWVAYGLTQAYRTNRSPAEALAFATKQKKTPSLSLLIGELYLADKKLDEALAILEPYTKQQDDSGYRASWLVSVIYADKQEFDKAKQTIEAQPKLAQDPMGKEALARIALLQGNTALADSLYTQLQDQSPEALSYLARKAFTEKDWEKARTLTEQLLLTFPDSPILRDNLNKIIEEQKAQQHK